MVIQRIQTLYLLVAVAAITVTFFFPIGFIPGEDQIQSVCVCAYPWYMGFTIAADALLLLSVFLYKALNVQIKTTLVGGLMVAASVIWLFFIGAGIAGEINWFNLALLIFSDVLAFLALRAMQKDNRLLRSYDRLR